MKTMRGAGMLRHRWFRLWSSGLLLAGVLACRSGVADWPTHRGGNGRSGMGTAEPTFPMREAWTWQGPRPAPAWGPPARRSYWQRLEHLEPRVAEDHVHPVVLAADALYVGSTTEDLVRCLDARTGAERWAFRVDGPVRYAPVVEAGKVYFGSDDGHVYAASADEGRLLWRRRLGPRDLRIPGNGRLISSWPVRSGVLVDGGTVFATAGLYPQQGAWAVALDAASGEERWREALEESPEGYLLLAGRMVVVPTGRASPVGLDRGTGRVVRRFDTGGGTYAVVAGDELFGGPGNDGALTGVGASSGERLISVRGRNLVAAEGRVYLLEAGTLRAVDRVRQAALGKQIKELEKKAQGWREAIRKAPSGTGAAKEWTEQLMSTQNALDEVRKEIARCELWRVACPADLCLVGTPRTLVAGGTNLVIAWDRATGRESWRASVDGRVLSLAAAAGRLVASTDRGGIHVFDSGTGDGEKAPRIVRRRSGGEDSPRGRGTVPARIREDWERLRRAGLPRQGYAAVAGLTSGDWIDALLAETDLHVVAWDADAERVRQIRTRWEARGDYGTRGSVHVVPAGELPFTDYFANVVVSERGLDGVGGDGAALAWNRAELDRIVRPFGGVSGLRTGADPVVRGPLEGAGAWTHQYGNPANSASSGDGRIGAQLALQWFGGPGPDVMVDRHLRGPAPLSIGGRLFVPGENLLLAVDAYNGTELWQRALPGSQRYSMPYDAGYHSATTNRIAVAVGGECWLLRVDDGELLQRHGVPEVARRGVTNGPPRVWHWGWTVLAGDGLFGSAQWSTASRTRPSYEQIDVDYGNSQPLVTGRAVFRVDPSSGHAAWVWSRGAVLNPTLALHRDTVLFVEGRAAKLATHATGRVALGEVLDGEPWLVALDAGTGTPRWEAPLEGEIATARNILFVTADGERVVLIGSRPGAGNDSEYLIECRRLRDGAVEWRARHPAGKPGEFTHGEQVHHPVMLGDWLVAEPAIYELSTGRRLAGFGGGAGDWTLVRPGHSCGTLSGAGDCIFFRAGNPTVLDLRASLRSRESPRKLAPSRTGCWINMIPAGGLLLVPEASAGCVCQYSLQTSMGFRPVGK